MPKLDFVFFDAGGGHRAAATALKQSCEDLFPDWEIRLVNLQEVLDSLDVFRQVTGVRMEDVYNTVLRKGWTLGSPQMLVAMHGLIKLYHPLQVKGLRKFWAGKAPDLVVSLVPNFNRALFHALHRVRPSSKLVTIMTDLADYPPSFWIEQGQEQYFICGTERAEQQALALGHTPQRVFRASGMILNPRFYQQFDFEIPAERQKLGLDPKLPTGLLLFGGYGSAVMERIASRLDDSGLKLQLVFICGKNEKLKTTLQALNLRMPHFIDGFTSQVPYYMKVSDFFIGKPGPGSISEAIHMGLPVIVTRNVLTLPQERYNPSWVQDNELGLVQKSFSEIVAAVSELLQPGTLARFQRNARKLPNRAVFEIPEILSRLLKN